MPRVQRHSVAIHDGTERSGHRATVELDLEGGRRAVVHFLDGGYALPQATVSDGAITAHLPGSMLAPALVLLQGPAPVLAALRDGRFVLGTGADDAGA